MPAITRAPPTVCKRFIDWPNHSHPKIKAKTGSAVWVMLTLAAVVSFSAINPIAIGANVPITVSHASGTHSGTFMAERLPVRFVTVVMSNALALPPLAMNQNIVAINMV